MLHSLEEGYWWPGMAQLVRQVCQQCLACQLQYAVLRRRDYIGGHLVPRMPRIAWSLDCAPAIRTAGGERATVLVIVDDFSKFVILVSIQHLTSQAMAQAFLE